MDVLCHVSYDVNIKYQCFEQVSILDTSISRSFSVPGPFALLFGSMVVDESASWHRLPVTLLFFFALDYHYCEQFIYEF